MEVPTLKVKPWGKGQGDYVIINESDYDESKHELFVEDEPKPKRQARKPKQDAEVKE